MCCVLVSSPSCSTELVTQYRLHSIHSSAQLSSFCLAGQIDPELKEFMSTFKVKFGLKCGLYGW